MGNYWNHKLSDVNLETKTAICKTCGPVKVRVTHKTGRLSCNNLWKASRDRYEKSDKGRAARRRAYLKYRGRSYRLECKMVCERCGFRARHIDQMDVHHKDRNSKNHDPSNLETLCACCHRLEHVKDKSKILTETVGPAVTIPTPIVHTGRWAESRNGVPSEWDQEMT